jgi:hypothetical protein
VAEIRFDFLGNADDLVRATDEASGALGTAEKSSDNFAKAAKVGLTAAAAAAAAAAASIAAVAKATVDLSAKANSYAKAAKKVGSTAEDIQRLEGAFALLTDANIDASRVIQDLGRNLADARDGAGEASDELAKLGLSAADLVGLPIPEQVALIADRFGGLQDSAEQSQVALAVFGRAGRELVPALAAGGDAVRQAVEQIEAAGIISNEAAEQSEKLQDSIELLSRTFDTLKRDILVPLIPVFTAVADEAKALLQRAQDTGALQKMAAVIVDQLLPGLSGIVRIGGRVVEAFVLQFKTINAFTEATRHAAAAMSALATGNFREAAAEAKKVGGEFVDLTRDVMNFGSASDSVADAIDRVVAAAKESAKSPIVLGDISMPGGSSGGGDSGGDAANVTPPAVVAFEKSGEAAQTYLGEFAEVLAEIESLSQAQHDAELQRINDAAVAREQALSSSLGAASSVFGSIGSLVQSVAEIDIAASGKTSAERRKAMKAAWEAQTALAIAQAAINIPLSISQAAAGPWPAAIGFMVAAGVASAAGLAGVIAKAAAGPTFHSGGVATAGDVGGLGPDEFSAVLRRGEGVLTPAAVQRVGGADGVQALNRGDGGSGGPMVVAVQLNNRTVDLQQRAALQRPDSPLSSALRASQPRKLGRHNPWSG